MSEFVIKRNDIVTVTTYLTTPARHNHYLGVVIGIVLPDGTEVNEHFCKFVDHEYNIKSKIKIKIKPKYKVSPGENYIAGLLEEIDMDGYYLEDPINISIVTEEKYEELRLRFLSKLNILSSLLYGANEFRLERLLNKPKPFKMK